MVITPKDGGAVGCWLKDLFLFQWFCRVFGLCYVYLSYVALKCFTLAERLLKVFVSFSCVTAFECKFTLILFDFCWSKPDLNGNKFGFPSQLLGSV